MRATRALDPLDWWARHLAGEPLTCDSQTLLDLALDLARAGFYAEAIEVLARAVRHDRNSGRSPRSAQAGHRAAGALHLGWLRTRLGQTRAARAAFRKAAAASPDYCFPARLEEIAILEAAMRANPKDARAPYYLGNLLYDRRRHDEAIRLWERSAKLDPGFPVVWRNLGIGYFNIRRQPARARAAYDKAFRAAPPTPACSTSATSFGNGSARHPERRLRELEKHLDLVRQRDDLSVELCALYNQTGQHANALQWLGRRRFQPWEGGEGGPLGQHVRSHLLLGRRCLEQRPARPGPRAFRSRADRPAPSGRGQAPAGQPERHPLLARLRLPRTRRWEERPPTLASPPPPSRATSRR